jgi:hypothetical protein
MAKQSAGFRMTPAIGSGAPGRRIGSCRATAPPGNSASAWAGPRTTSYCDSELVIKTGLPRNG